MRRLSPVNGSKAPANTKKLMTTTTAPETLTTQKTRELCQAIVDRPGFTELKRKLDAFMENEAAKFQFQMLNERGGILQQKQAGGLTITDEEIGQFEALRDGVLKDSVTTDFIDVQKEMQAMQEMVMNHLQKTFELGRVPTQEDFDSCSSSSCGCH